jgi:hypothetical protein
MFVIGERLHAHTVYSYLIYDTVHIFNRNWVDTRWQQYTHLHTNNTHNTEKGKFWKCGPCPVFASYTLVFALQLRKKHGKPSVRVAQYKNNERYNTQKKSYTKYYDVTEQLTTQNTKQKKLSIKSISSSSGMRIKGRPRSPKGIVLTMCLQTHVCFWTRDSLLVTDFGQISIRLISQKYVWSTR